MISCTPLILAHGPSPLNASFVMWLPNLTNGSSAPLYPFVRVTGWRKLRPRKQ